jgi:hypothetical protein
MNARFYVVSIGRFASADSIVPEPTNPQSHNRYSYVLNNPLLLTDPSGHCADYYYDDEACWQAYADATGILGSGFDFLKQWSLDDLQRLLTWLERGIRFEGGWSSDGLYTALDGLDGILTAVGSWDLMSALLGIHDGGSFTYLVDPAYFPNDGAHYAIPWEKKVVFDSNPDLTSFLHETGHIVDYYLEWYLDESATNFWWSETGLVGLGWNTLEIYGTTYFVRSQDIGTYRSFTTASPIEDFADTFTAWVYEEMGHTLPAGWQRIQRDRRMTLTTALGEVIAILP